MQNKFGGKLPVSSGNILFNRKLPFNRQLDLLRSKNLNDSASHLKNPKKRYVHFVY